LGPEAQERDGKGGRGKEGGGEEGRENVSCSTAGRIDRVRLRPRWGRQRRFHAGTGGTGKGWERGKGRGGEEERGMSPVAPPVV